MAINVESNDDGSSVDLFYLLKNRSNSELGGRVEGLIPKYFSDADVGVIQNTALAQLLNTSEFKPAAPGALKQGWATYLAKGEDDFRVVSKDLGIELQFIHKLTWTIDSTGTDEEVARSREIAWATSLVDAWDKAYDEIRTMEDVVIAENCIFNDVMGANFNGKSLADLGVDTLDEFGEIFKLSVIDIISSTALGPSLSTEEILNYITSLTTNTSLTLAGGSSESYILNKYNNRYYDQDTGALKESPASASILAYINSLYAPDLTSAQELFQLEKDNISLYSIDKSTTQSINDLSSRVGEVIKSSIVFRDKTTLEEYESLPEGADPEDFDEIKISLYDRFVDNLSQTKLGRVTTMLSGIEVNHWLINNMSFTELIDTPTGYESGYYLKSSATGIEYIDVTGLAKELSPFIGGVSGFSGLHDTPTGYLSGYYLRSNETGIEYLSPQDLADDVADEIVQTLVTGKLMAFTGLYDTPTGYLSGYYLESTATGISYIDPTGLARKIPTIPNAYDFVPGDMEDGEIIKVGCDLYLSCDGEWKNLGSPEAPEIENLPGCVANLSQAVEYQEYKEEFLAQNMGNTFDQMLNSNTDTSDSIYNVCLFSNESNSTVKIDETTYPWGIFNEPQTVNITAIPGTASYGDVEFKHWTGAGAVFGDFNKLKTTLVVDKNLSVTGCFNLPDIPITATFLQKIIPIENLDGDQFGSSISRQGDLMMVGARTQTSTAYKAGSVYIYKLENGVWTYTQEKLYGHFNTHGNETEIDYFGTSVSLDGNRVVIGAENDTYYNSEENITKMFAGSVSVFELVDDEWVLQTKLWHHDQILNGNTEGLYYSRFGSALSLEGDRMAAGMASVRPLTDSSYYGAVYIYDLVDDEWTITDRITADDFENIDDRQLHFGSSVVLKGDQLFVGVTGDDEENSGAGSVYVYQLVNDEWTLQQKIYAPDADLDDKFGSGLSVSNDILVVGSVLEDEAGLNAGAVYVYKLIDGMWTYKSKILPLASDIAGQVPYQFGFTLFLEDDQLMVYAGVDEGIFLYKLNVT